MDDRQGRSDETSAKRDGHLIAAVRCEIEGSKASPRLPGRVGRYNILGLLGRGGMGVVYRAAQERTNRTVALKIIAPELVSPRRLRRFAQEVELLGRLQHPGIAQVHEADVVETDHGPQPFFAMELVAGERLTKYAEAHRLGTRPRLELFAKVCDAVQHAHQKGVIHRDLKPANILVDESGQPRILDFGVACATDADLQATTGHTDIGHFIGTLPYMSPEQVACDSEVLDTRSDVYSLGVVGYELLAGRLPYDVAHKSIPEAVRVICEASPTRLSATRRFLRGDIETIFAKALEKDADRRYASVSDLSSDVRRYLRDEPIQAAPPSAANRLRKFAWRNKALSAAFIVGLLGLVATTVGTSIGLLQARRAQAQALTKANTAERVTDFMIGLFAMSDPGEPDAADITAREILDRGAQQIDSELKEEPEVRATLQDALSKVYRRLGIYEEAYSLAASALETRRGLLGPDHPDTLASMYQLALVHRCRGELEEAEALQREVLQRRREVLGAEHPDVLASMNDLAAVLVEAGRSSEAEPLQRAALQKRREVLGVEHPSTLSSMTNLAVLLKLQGDLVEAEDLYREAVAISNRVLGGEHPATLNRMNNLVALLLVEDQLEEADTMSLAVVEVCRRRSELERASITLRAMHNRAAVLRALGDLGAAEAIIRETLELYRRLRGDEHPDTLTAINTLLVLLEDQGKLDEAEPMRRELIDAYHRSLGAHHPRTSIATVNLALLLDRQSKYEEAAQFFEQAIESMERTLPPHHQVLAFARGNLGRLLYRRQRYAEAEPLLLAAYEGFARSLGAEHEYTQYVVSDLIGLYDACGKPELAAAWQTRSATTQPAPAAGGD